MIKVNVCTKDAYITSVHISGHALSDEHGRDLVCAGASSISVGALNALHELCTDKCSLNMKEADIRIDTTSHDEVVQVILKTLYIQLQTLEQQYSDYIKIVKEEV